MAYATTTEIVPDIQLLAEMLSYRRKEGSVYQKHFCDTYLKPIFGEPDLNGNYIVQIGQETPRIAFMAHHDTVHVQDGKQSVNSYTSSGDLFYCLPPNSKSNCLGADCTTGVWLILHMIQNNVPGLYIVHAAEEVGMRGSSALVQSDPLWMAALEAAISFDRKGVNSIITHQCGARTASDKFCWELNSILGGGFKPDDTGVYTDSEAYAYYVPECTNISVGYYDQHTKKEVQNVTFASELATKLVKADWSKLNAYRDPSVAEYSNYMGFRGVTEVGDNYWSQWDDDYGATGGVGNLKGKKSGINQPREFDTTMVSKGDEMEDIIAEHPTLVAGMLRQYGITREDLIRECGLWEGNW